MTRKIAVDLEDVEDIIGWWRGANEAPGGCSAFEAIQGMREAVRNMEMARRRQMNE
jgi:hypothetical protein